VGTLGQQGPTPIAKRAICLQRVASIEKVSVEGLEIVGT